MYQSFNCQERLPRDRPRWAYEKSTLNGDGFGVGWSLKPAWSDRNLKSLAAKTASNLIFAHVRAAGPGSGDSAEGNCHPFNCGRFMFMHNGVVGEWERSRRVLMKRLQTNAALDFALDHTPIDSVVIFAMFIDLLDRGANAQYSPKELQTKLEQVLVNITSVCDEERIEDVSYINVAITDGSTIVGSRHAIGPYSSRRLSNKENSGSPGEKDPCPSLSLYFASGTRWVGGVGGADYSMVQCDDRREVFILTSEPLTEVRSEWVPVPHNHIIVITNKCDVSLVPIKGTKPTLVGCLDLRDDGLVESPRTEKVTSHTHCEDGENAVRKQLCAYDALGCVSDKSLSPVDELGKDGPSGVMYFSKSRKFGQAEKAVNSSLDCQFTYKLAGSATSNISIWRDGVLLSSIQGHKNSILSVQVFSLEDRNGLEQSNNSIEK